MTEQEIERTLKWYCMDCSCNDHCKDHKCAFYSFFEEYLKGKDNALPPKDEWNVHHPFHRFHRQLLSNLQNWAFKQDFTFPLNNSIECKAELSGFRRGIKETLKMVREEIEYLAKED